MRIDGTGYVGIGTTTPTAPLEILSSAVGIEALNLHRSTSNNNVGTGVLLQRSRADSTAPGAGFGSDIQFDLEGFTNNTFASAANIAVGWEVAQTNDTTARDSYLAYSTMLDNASAERMRITSAGRVGIGTTSPSTDVMLDVNGNMKATGRIYSGATTDTDALSNISLSFTSANLIRATGASAACGTLNFTNVLAGQSVSVTIPNATTTCSTIQLSGSTANVKLPSGYTGGAAVTGVVYTALYDGTTLWVSWVPF